MSSLIDSYKDRYGTALKPIAESIADQLIGYFEGIPHIDRITARAKSVDRFIEKAKKKKKNGDPKYTDPIIQIQDQIGVRIVVYYLSDVEDVSKIVEKYYRRIESLNVVPDSEWKFGYFGRHYIMIVPPDLIHTNLDSTLVPEFFELQVKTLFQHAWSEANHDLGYNQGAIPIESDAERWLALASAQAWGADRIFEQLLRAREA